MRIMKRSAFRLILLAAVFCCIFCSSAADTWYVENEWNYLDSVMDPDGGIPEEAEGVLAQIQRNGVLRVAADFDFAPLNFLDPEAGESGQYAGLDMMLARKIAEKRSHADRLVYGKRKKILRVCHRRACKGILQRAFGSG